MILKAATEDKNQTTPVNNTKHIPKELYTQMALELKESKEKVTKLESKVEELKQVIEHEKVLKSDSGISDTTIDSPTSNLESDFSYDSKY